MKKTGITEPVASSQLPVAGAASAAQVVTTIAPARAQLTLAEVRAKLEGKNGRRFWKNLDELAETPGFDEMLEREFPRQASEWVDAVSRRGFLKVMGASLALAGLAGCTKQPDEPIFPYVKAPEDLILGKPMYFATAFPFPTGAIPVLVKSDAFRPIKVDGNPDHPMAKGKSDALTQATLLDLYDPDRSKEVLYRGQRSEFADFQEAFTKAVKATKDGDGRLLPERDSDVADAGSAVEAGAGEVSRGEVCAVGAGEPRCSDGGFEGGFRRLHRRAVQAGKRGRDSVTRCGFPRRNSPAGIPAHDGGICAAASL